MLEVLKLIRERHSEKALYDVERPIAKLDLRQILEAARWAPADQEVKTVLEIPEHLKIAFGIRLGYAPPAEGTLLRVRRDVEEFTHHNRFGNRTGINLYPCQD